MKGVKGGLLQWEPVKLNSRLRLFQQSQSNLLSLPVCVQFQKQIATLNELASNLIELITNAREDWEGEQSAGIA